MQTRAWLLAEISKLLIGKRKRSSKNKKRREIVLKEEKIGSF